MDRGELLAFYLLAVWGLWGERFYSLYPTLVNPPSGQLQILGTYTLYSIIASAIGGLLYLHWPSKSRRQAEIERQMIKRHMNHIHDEMKADGLRDSGSFLGVFRTRVAPEEEVKNLLIRFPHGETREHKVRFFYVTVTNEGSKTADDVIANSGVKQLRFVPLTGKPTFGIDFDDESPEEFDKRGTVGFAVALQRDHIKVKDKIEFVHPSSKGSLGFPFVLFFTLEGFDDRVYIPTHTIIWQNIYGGSFGGRWIGHTKGIIKVPLDITARDSEQEYSTLFVVNFRTWNDFDVKQVKHSGL